MAKRLRLLIYEGPQDWLEMQRKRDGVKGVHIVDSYPGYEKTITSIELDPLRITLLQVVRVLWREWRGEKAAEKEQAATK